MVVTPSSMALGADLVDFAVASVASPATESSVLASTRQRLSDLGRDRPRSTPVAHRARRRSSTIDPTSNARISSPPIHVDTHIGQNIGITLPPSCRQLTPSSERQHRLTEAALRL